MSFPQISCNSGRLFHRHLDLPRSCMMRVSLLPQSPLEELVHRVIDPPWVVLLFSKFQPSPNKLWINETPKFQIIVSRPVTFRLCFWRNCSTAARVLESTFSGSTDWTALFSLWTSLFWLSDASIFPFELLVWGIWFISNSIFFVFFFVVNNDNPDRGFALCQLSNLITNTLNRSKYYLYKISNFLSIIFIRFVICLIWNIYIIFKKGRETEIGNVGDHQPNASLTLLCSLS